MIFPACRLPAAPILQVSVIAIHCAIDIDHRKTAMQLFKLFYILLTIIPYAADRSAWGQKVFFSFNTCAFYSAVTLNQCGMVQAWVGHFVTPITLP